MAAADLLLTHAAEVQALLAQARAAWPDVALADESFARHLAERLPADVAVEAALATVHASDLYLACACLQGDERAQRTFDETFMPQISSHLRRAGVPPAIDDEVKQAVRARLFIGPADMGPRIAAYSGRGPLGAWLRVTATREALKLRAWDRGSAAPTDAFVLPGAAADPDLEYLKTHYADDLRQAFESTLAALEARESAVLRFYYLDAMSAQAIAAMYGVSSRTIQRWVIETRAKILAETQRRLAERLGLAATEVATLVGMLQSQLDISILRHLGR
jgi:RNA polymerase sigma-70 factor (ECF subfamily)